MESQDAIYSLYKDQPIYRDLLMDFVSCLDDRISRSQTAFASKSWVELGQIMHQLRGAAATYGFPGLAELAGSIEIASTSPVIEEDSILGSMKTVTDTCKRIESGMANLLRS